MSIDVEKLTEFHGSDVEDLCQATEAAIRDGIGFNWLTPPTQDVLESYWKGVMVVPERILCVGRLDGTVAGAIQVVKPGPTKETSAFAAQIEGHFVAPWARGHGIAKALLDLAEREARAEGFTLLKLSVRETQEAAIKLYAEHGYVHWGTLPYYEFVGARMLAGHFYYKQLDPITTLI